MYTGAIAESIPMLMPLTDRPKTSMAYLSEVVSTVIPIMNMQIVAMIDRFLENLSAIHLRADEPGFESKGTGENLTPFQSLPIMLPAGAPR
jgi:hypothetical protein